MLIIRVNRYSVILVVAFLVMIFNFINLSASSLDEQWSKTYSLNFKNEIRDTIATSDGGTISVGSTHMGNEYSNGYILKTDANGVKLWEKQYGGSLDDTLLAVSPTKDGGFIAVGLSNSFDYSPGAAQLVGWILKIDSNGNEVFSKSYRDTIYGANQTTNNLVLHDIVLASDGGYVIAGKSVLSATRRGIVIKIDENANEIWNKKYGVSDTYLSSIVNTNDGGYMLAGASSKDASGNDSSTGYMQGLIIKIDNNGNQQWYKLYENGENHISKISMGKDGNFIVTGRTYLIDESKNASWFMKVDSSGNVIWKKTYSSLKWPTSQGLVTTDDGGAIFVGYALAPIEGYQMVGAEDAWIFKVDALGEIEWQKQLGLAERNFLTTIVEVPTGYIASGLTGSASSTKEMNAWLVKFASKYKLSFDLNGGDSLLIDDQFLYEQETTNDLAIPTRDGYTFKGWNTAADGSGNVWDISSSMPKHDVTLYAQWEIIKEPISKYTVNFDLNGGEGIAPEKQILNVDEKVVEPTKPIRSGYIFKGWSTTKNNSELLWDFKYNKMQTTDVTLYAQWEKSEETQEKSEKTKVVSSIKTNVPKTGDTSNAILFSTILILSGITLVLVNKRKFIK